MQTIYNTITDILGVVNSPLAPLEEEYFNAPDFIDYLPNEHFHHGHKGCKVHMVKTYSSKDLRISVNKICETHNCTCSKTGWQLGWYLGNDNKNISPKKIINCAICGKEIKVNVGNSKYCNDCYVIHNRELSLAHYAKNKKNYWNKKNAKITNP